MNESTSLGWWLLHGDTLMDFLRRAHDGEDPDTLLAEIYANAEHEDYRE